MLIMPFGKHKGKSLDEVPLAYLTWMLKNCALYGDLKEAVEKECGVPPIKKPPSPEQEIEGMMKELDQWKKDRK